MTLHGKPAWAGTDYTQTAYTYGDNAGLCKNPDFEEDPNEPEFVQCEEDDRYRDDQQWDVEGEENNSGTQEFGPNN